MFIRSKNSIFVSKAYEEVTVVVSADESFSCKDFRAVKSDYSQSAHTS
jgi:hypothetical protein